MTRKFTASEDVGGGGNSIDAAGTYHCAITSAADGETTRGNPISGCSAVLAVLAGTAEGQTDKEFHLHLFDPDESKSEEAQKWARRKQTAYAIAINQIDPAKLAEPALDVDFGESAVGQQIIVTLDWNEYEGKRNLQLAFANIYHVDDPRAARFPKNVEALALIDAKHRRKPEYFAPLERKANGRASQQSRLSAEELATL